MRQAMTTRQLVGLFVLRLPPFPRSAAALPRETGRERRAAVEQQPCRSCAKCCAASPARAYRRSSAKRWVGCGLFFFLFWRVTVLRSPFPPPTHALFAPPRPKAKRWSCKTCGEKQSVKQIYHRGTGGRRQQRAPFPCLTSRRANNKEAQADAHKKALRLNQSQSFS